MIGFDFVTRHKKDQTAVNIGNVHDDGTKKRIMSHFVTSELDLGAFIIKASVIESDTNMRFVNIAKSIGMNTFAADGYFIEYAASKDIKKRLHRQILLIHQ